MVIGNARRLWEGGLDRYIHRKADEPEGRIKELDARGLQTVGVFIFLLLARECVEGKGGHARERMDMCGTLRKDRRTTLLYIFLSLRLVC